MAKVGIGSTIDHYKLIEELGHGGMGVVYKALNVYLDKYVAIKTIAIGLDAHENFINRFRTEARALAKLEDPNIVRIYDFRVDDEQWFIVMEYVEGGTLAERIRNSQPIPYLSAIPIMKQLLNAIGHAHHVGIIHRDIKPNNVMITRDGIVKVTDFGLAKDKHHHSNTFAGSTGGTLYYMSPEQVKGLHLTDHRSDIYSLGLTFYEMLAGKIPFRKDDTDFAIREAIIKRQFPPPSHFNAQIPVGLNNIVMRAIEKNADARFQSVHEMMESIIQFEKHEGFWAPATPKRTYRDDSMYDLSKINTPAISVSSPASTREKKTSTRWYIFAAVLSVLIPLLVWFSSIQLSMPEFFHSDSEDHQVTIRTNPDAVLVIANGDTLGRTPLMKTLLPAGHVHFILTKDNFVQHDTSMFINPEQDSMLMFSLLNQAAADETEFENAQSAADSGMIRIRTLPDGVAIYKNNVYIGRSPVEPLQLSAGSYNFHFRKDGYDVQKRNVRVRAGSNRLLTVAMSGHTGSLEVISEPPDAQIWIDGQAISGRSTPAIIAQLSVGTHLLALKKEGHVEYEKEINISAKNTTKLTAELIAATGEVNILVKPWGSIFINNILKKKNSNVSFKEELVVGEHLVKIVHPSLGTWEKMVTIENDQRRELIIDFSKTVNIPVAAFDVNGKPVWAQIIVDDVPTGNITPKEISVRIGKRKISASIDGYELVNGARSLMLEQNLAEPLTFVLRRRI